jgi:hypothetical protein
MPMGMLIFFGGYQNYQNGVVSNQVTDAIGAGSVIVEMLVCRGEVP